MVCLDSTFLIDYLRGNTALEAVLKKWEVTNERVAIPSPALAEVASGAALEQTGREQKLLDAICTRFIVVPLTEQSARRAGKIDAELTEAGELIGLVDAMIAAIAIEQGEVLVTRNLRHFNRIRDLRAEGY